MWKKPNPARRTGRRLFRRYIALVSSAVLMGASAVLAVNSAVDPLWYWRGNIITGENFAFNERFAKLNLFLRNRLSYDCLIFGSSRVTLLDQRRVSGHTCANLSFSAGVVSEYVAYARYIKAQGFSPKLVVVGVDAFNFWRSMKPKLPGFVERGALPPGWLRTYLSIDVLKFSLQTLSGESPLVRAYDKNFIGRVDERAPTYDPPEATELVGKIKKFDASRQAMYVELREVFPEARFVGYVPPISAWRVVEELYLTGYLEPYLRIMVAIAERFDAMYDFSVPSEATMRPENTYDGSHFSTAVNAAIADVLQGRSNYFGIDVRDLTLAEYIRVYKNAITGFLQSIEDD